MVWLVAPTTHTASVAATTAARGRGMLATPIQVRSKELNVTTAQQ